jgi:hypothetical protein
VIYCYVIIINLSYIIIQVHTPLGVNSAGVHDDALYMSMGRSLAEGRWLGAFDQFTLVKGPGYGVFLVLGHWLGISVSLAHALFHCSAITLFVLVVHRMVGSILLSGLLLALLVWHPISMTVYLLRVYRDAIYHGQILIFLAAFIWMLFYARGRGERSLFAALSGVLLGWLWLTREEGGWIVPALVFLVAVSAYRALHERRVRGLAATLLIFLGVFTMTQVGFRTLNWLAYGSYVGVDVKEPNFQRALVAIHSVRSGGTRPFVSITRAARERVYPVSGAFQSLAGFLEGPASGWIKVTCDVNPIACGEIGSGWFMFALRDATAAIGHYATPAEASSFFGQLADEISTACKRGDLECLPQSVPDMPPVSWRQIAEGFRQRAMRVIDLLIFLNPPLQASPSTGTEESLAKDLQFLNFPTHTRSAQSPPVPTSYSLSGWYYNSGGEWFRVQIRSPDGSLAEVSLNRRPSPDIQQVFHDPAATDQRFTIRTRCRADCVMQFRASEGVEVDKSLADLRGAPIEFTLGPGRMFIDTTEVRENSTYITQRSEDICNVVRTALLRNYKFLFLPVLVIGIIAFVASTVLYWKNILSNMSYILALTSWMLVVLRCALLTLIDATLFPSLHGQYMAPAYFLLVCGAVLSCAAWLQLSSVRSIRA